MEIYLDANATTPVLPCAREAALAAMWDAYGNPSSAHGSGLKARALLEAVRARAREVLGLPVHGGARVLFTSGATEGIQTAVLSVLSDLRRRREAGEPAALQLLHGATEHKAVPEALKHWNAVLGLGLPIRAIPVGRDGRHDLAWLRAEAPTAALVCTMAVNNETGVISDLDGIAAALRGSPARWLVDAVQALGKLPLALLERGIDYAPFSGHKLYAPKGIGLLCVRAGAPFTPLLAGGGQEGAARAGTENMAGIAALGAVLGALEQGDGFSDAATMQRHRARLAAALEAGFPGLVFNAPPALCLPTTLNFAVAGVEGRVLLDLFDAAGLRISGGSACSASRAAPSAVLEAMGVPSWQARGAVRLSFGAADDTVLIDEACRRIRICGEALRASGLVPAPATAVPPPSSVPAADGPTISRFAVDGACCYVVTDHGAGRCVVIDPLPELEDSLLRWLGCRPHVVVAVLDTHSRGDHAPGARRLLEVLPAGRRVAGPVDARGWPAGRPEIDLGRLKLTRLALPGHTADSTAYLLYDAGGLSYAFVGDVVMPGALGCGDFAPSEPRRDADPLDVLSRAVGLKTLLLPGRDDESHFATTLEIERDIAPTASGAMVCGARVEAEAGRCTVSLDGAALAELLAAEPAPLLVDVREAYEQRLGPAALPHAPLETRAVPFTGLIDALPGWLSPPPPGTRRRPLLFICRSGHRSAQVARSLRRLGHAEAWGVAGGLALLPDPCRSPAPGTGGAARGPARP